MRSRILLPTLLASACALTLAACGSNAPDAPDGPEASAVAGTASEAAGAAPSATPGTAVPETAPEQQAAAAAPRDNIRGKGGLEEKCLKAVAAQGTTVVGTNRIEESQAAVEVYVNVVGGAAPWRCRGSRDGTVETVEYTETEGEL